MSALLSVKTKRLAESTNKLVSELLPSKMREAGGEVPPESERTTSNPGEVISVSARPRIQTFPFKGII